MFIISHTHVKSSMQKWETDRVVHELAYGRLASIGHLHAGCQGAAERVRVSDRQIGQRAEPARAPGGQKLLPAQQRQVSSSSVPDTPASASRMLTFDFAPVANQQCQSYISWRSPLFTGATTWAGPSRWSGLTILHLAIQGRLPGLPAGIQQPPAKGHFQRAPARPAGRRKVLRLLAASEGALQAPSSCYCWCHACWIDWQMCGYTVSPCTPCSRVQSTCMWEGLASGVDDAKR